jgi:hypothetical protein
MMEASQTPRGVGGDKVNRAKKGIGSGGDVRLIHRDRTEISFEDERSTLSLFMQMQMQPASAT